MSDNALNFGIALLVISLIFFFIMFIVYKCGLSRKYTLSSFGLKLLAFFLLLLIISIILIATQSF